METLIWNWSHNFFNDAAKKSWLLFKEQSLFTSKQFNKDTCSFTKIELMWLKFKGSKMIKGLSVLSEEKIFDNILPLISADSLVIY